MKKKIGKSKKAPCQATSGAAARLLPPDRIDRAILLIRGEKVMLDHDLARLYGVTTGNLNKAVGRNVDRSPADFMFQLTRAEFEALRGDGAAANLIFQSGTSRWGGRRKLPYAFSEQGVAMLSSVLRSKRAVQVNIAIMRAFVRLRLVLSTHKDLARKIEDLDRKFSTRTDEHDRHIRKIYEVLEALMEPPAAPKKGRIGFRPPGEARQ